MFGLKRLARIGLKRSRGAVNFVPEIVAGECDMGPGKRCDLGEQFGGNIDALGANIIDSAAAIDCVPQDIPSARDDRNRGRRLTLLG